MTMVERVRTPGSAREAKSIGASRYFTGVMCKAGHIAERMTANRCCVECRGQIMLRYRAKDPERTIARDKRQRESGAERIKKYTLDRYYNHRDKIEMASRKWRQANPEKECARTARRKAMVLQASPAWADSESILRIYRAARRITQETGVKHHVDHIIPLQGTTVCGRHVANNLRVITASENARKKNKLIDAALTEGEG